MGRVKRRRQKKFLRTEKLAKPRYITHRYIAPKYDHRGRKYNRYFGNVSARLEQLALPNVRNLLATKENHKQVLIEKHFENLNEFLKKSNQTIYSKLANVQLPEEPKKEKWSEERWNIHREWQKSRAIHRKSHSEEFFMESSKIPITRTYSGKIQYDDSAYLTYLSTPRSLCSKFIPIKKPRHYVKKSTLFYEATENINKLATPAKLTDEHQAEEYNFENPYDIPKYLQKTKSIGIKNLAMPKKSKLLQKELDRENAELQAKLNCVSPFALKYKPTENMNKLAEPRKNESRKPDRTDFKVSPAAIKGPPKTKAAYYEKLATPKKINK